MAQNRPVADKNLPRRLIAEPKAQALRFGRRAGNDAMVMLGPVAAFYSVKDVVQ